jgi:hypothetical protein
MFSGRVTEHELVVGKKVAQWIRILEDEDVWEK